MQEALSHIPDVDRPLTGCEGLMAAQEAIKGDEARDAFAKDFTVLSRIWEALHTDELQPFRDDYRWLAQVYESVRPTSGIGRPLWQSLGPKTLDLIHDHIDVRSIRDDFEELILDDEIIVGLDEEEQERTRQDKLRAISQRLKRRSRDPEFRALSERLERLRVQHELDVLSSLEWLKDLLELARDVVRTEQERNVQLVGNGKPALAQIFEEVRVEKTPKVIARVIDDIEEIMRATTFEGWQSTVAGEREVPKALRKTLLKYQLNKEHDLFDRAYKYVRQHY